MTDPRLTRELHPVLRRVRKVRWLKSLALGWLTLAALGGLLLWLPPGWPAGALFVAAGLLIAIGVVASAWPRSSDRAVAARLIEEQYPDLDTRLLTAFQQQPDLETGRYHFLQREVVSDVLVHARRRNWSEAVPGSRLMALRAANLFSVLLALLTGILLFSEGRTRNAEAVAGADPAAAGATAGYDVEVEPGNTEIERGTSLLVLARFAGNLPADVELVATDQSGTVQRVPLSKSLDLSDPLFGGRLPEVASDLTYHVEFDGERSDEFRVATFEYPRLVQADAQIRQPTYTGLPDKSYKDVRRVSLVEGSELTLTFHLNKPVAQASLIGESGSVIPLEVREDGVVSDRMATFRPDESDAYRLVLVDGDGRENRDPPEITVDVVPNRAPELTATFPGKDMKVTPLQELVLQATAWDDFGLKEYGLVLQTPSGSEQLLVLGSEAEPDETVDFDHLMPLEDINAEPNDLIAYYFYADDIGPSGDVRRTYSDMYFAEVRHFDEIYRQAPSQQSQQSQSSSGNPAQQLVQLQRQVVTATWNTLRKFPADPGEDKQGTFAEDLETLTDSETTALELTQQYLQTLDDLIARQFANEAAQQMIVALEQYRLSHDSRSVPPLSDAMVAARAALAALLKLQAREHLVMNAQSSSQSSSSQSQRQLDQQLKQLELQNDRNRYETERQAQQESENREQLQVLNRLRELARRQEDLNQKIQELENALRKAETEEEKRELERQLKRLQEEQQEMLRDVDELRERMNRDENRMQMADARRQLEETRENVLQTSEHLREQQVSRALASGTRAQRELQELRDDIRKETANEFAEAMSDLREEARELADRQEEIGKQLQGTQEKGRPSLRETSGNSELAEQLNEQKERLNSLLSEMRDIVEQSEESEPLLSRRLYETIRESRGDRPVESLEMASELLRRGFPDEGRQAEQVARGAIERIRDGVEQAADSVLGDELESLQRAKDELATLTQSIEQELSRSDPDFRPQPARTNQQRQQEGQQRGDQQGQQRGDQQGQQRGDQQGQQRGDQQGQQRGDQQGQQRGDQQGQQRGDQQGQQRGDQQGQQRGDQQSQQRGDQQSQQRGDQQGQQRGDQQGQQRGDQQGQQPGNQQGQQRGDQQGQQRGDQQSQQRGDQQGQQRGDQQGQQPGNQPGQQPGDQQGQQPGRSGRSQSSGSLASALNGGSQTGGGHAGPNMPLTGGDFMDWSDRMRDVEEMLTDPELRSAVARVRDRAREIRIEVKQHARAPNWTLVRTSIYGELVELQDRIAEEIAREQPDNELVPIDRDPVPDRYSELVRTYYERLGRQRP